MFRAFNLFVVAALALSLSACATDDDAASGGGGDVGAMSAADVGATSAADASSAADSAAPVDTGGARDTGAAPSDTETARDTTSADPDTEAAPDTTPPEDTAPPPEPVTCLWTANPAGVQEVNTWMGDVPSVTFRVPGMPDPAGITSARLLYYGYDVDHPGEEGWIEVNGTAPIALPADEALDNGGRAFEVDVSGRLVEGRNRVTFLAWEGPEGAFFQISQVQLEATGPGLACPDPPEEGPTGDGVERTLNYRAATYEMRRNWVLECRDYAYSARFDEHEACDDRYNPDGTGHGRAIFVFEGVIADRYEVRVEGRHTENRNSAGALFIVNGVERRISQRSDTDYTWVQHGVYDLSGRVEVILDSTREDGSDSVRNVQLRPVR